jgi:hypothetical protein
MNSVSRGLLLLALVLFCSTSLVTSFYTGETVISALTNAPLASSRSELRFGRIGKGDSNADDDKNANIDKQRLPDVTKAKLKKSFEEPKPDHGYHFHVRLGQPPTVTGTKFFFDYWSVFWERNHYILFSLFFGSKM